MMTEKKIVTVSGLNLSSMHSYDVDDLCKALEALKEYDYNVLILSVPAGQLDEGVLPKRPSARLSLLAEYLTPVHFPSISGAKLTAWVGKHLGHHGVNAPPEVCAHLIEFSGKSMFVLAAETEKLAYYVLSEGRDTVTREDVERVSVTELDTETFALTNAVLDGKYEDAIHALEVMRFRRMDPVMIMGQISRTVSDLCLVKALYRDGMRPPEIAATLKMSEFKIKLNLNTAVARSDKRLRRALELCSEADRQLKQTSYGYLALERLITTI